MHTGQTVKQGNTVDLMITERPAGNVGSHEDFRFCTLTKNSKQKTINFRLPDEIQQKILQAYQQGKVVRIFA